MEERASPRLLVVDDHAPTLTILRKFLTHRGFTVGVRDDRQAALEAVRAEDYALVLMDMHMPGLSLLEALAAIKAARKSLPVMLMTADADADLVRESVLFGALGPLRKPLELERLAATLRATLGLEG